MCSRVTCAVCGKASWEGCGQHVEEALQGVPNEQRCAGHTAGDGGAGLPASRRTDGAGLLR